MSSKTILMCLFMIHMHNYPKTEHLTKRLIHPSVLRKTKNSLQPVCKQCKRSADMKLNEKKFNYFFEM